MRILNFLKKKNYIFLGLLLLISLISYGNKTEKNNTIYSHTISLSFHRPLVIREKKDKKTGREIIVIKEIDNNFIYANLYGYETEQKSSKNERNTKYNTYSETNGNLLDEMYEKKYPIVIEIEKAVWQRYLNSLKDKSLKLVQIDSRNRNFKKSYVLKNFKNEEEYEEISMTFSGFEKKKNIEDKEKITLNGDVIKLKGKNTPYIIKAVLENDKKPMTIYINDK